ncbi:unnamed protein product, partial [Prorocentrum cordatum]
TPPRPPRRAPQPQDGRHRARGRRSGARAPCPRVSRRPTTPAAMEGLMKVYFSAATKELMPTESAPCFKRCDPRAY